MEMRDTVPTIRFSHLRSHNFNKQWILTFEALLPSSCRIPITPTEVTSSFQEHVKNNTEQRDLKFLEILPAHDKQIGLRFLIEKWVADNFQMTGQFHAPASLEWRYPHDIPRIVFVNAQSVAVDLISYIERFSVDYIKKQNHLLFNDNWKTLNKISSEMFTFSLDRAQMKLRASLKPIYILGSLALYSALYKKPSITLQQFEELKTRASVISNLSRLDDLMRDFR